MRRKCKLKLGVGFWAVWFVLAARDVMLQAAQQPHAAASCCASGSGVFGDSTCRVIGQACPARADCTRLAEGPRTLSFKPKAEFEVLQWARRRENTQEFQERYAKRAGIEGTISQGTRSCNLRRSRYIGQAKTHLQHILIAIAINLARFVDWMNQVPRAATRTSAFVALAQE